MASTGYLPSLPSSTADAAPAANAVIPFLWGAATSSYQVEGGIDCSDPNLPCDDYDFFNRDLTIHNGISYNTGLVGPKVDTRPAGIADNVWEPSVYKRDFDYARLLGLNAFRFSLEWSRIEPEAPTLNSDGTLTHHWDETAIQHYVDMVDAMRARGLTPILTLNHFTLPIWVLRPPVDYVLHPLICPLLRCPTDQDPGFKNSLGGWTNTATIDRYVDFVKKVVPYFRGKVDFWLTINEPVGSQVGVGYVAGIWPPGFLSDGPKAKLALHNLILAHVRGYDAISDCTNNPDCDNVDADGDGVAKRVGFAHAMGPTVASPPGFGGNAGLNAIAADNFDYFLSNYFVNAVVNGEEDTTYLNSNGLDRTGEGTTSICPDQNAQPTSCVHNEWKNHLDFLGINYYRRFHVYHDDKLPLFGTGFLGGNQHNNLYGEPKPHELLNDLGWAMYPQGLYDLIMRAKNKWNVPVMITENGIPERNDRNRAADIVAHLRQVARAIADGASVLGYMHWSLIDNWELQENYSPQSQFGLFHIDRNRPDPANPDLHRQLTEGALAYQQVIEESRINSPSGSPTQAALDSAREKFGELSADGMQILPPSRTHGRLWEGTTAEGSVTLYLGYLKANQKITGMIYWHNLRQWRRVDLLVDSSGPFLHESWFDEVVGAMTSRDIRVSHANGVFTFPGSPSYSAARIPGTGLWRWNIGNSPWGSDFFYVSKLEGEYAGKYLTFSSPGPKDAPTPVCGPGGCVPQVAGPNWRPLSVTQAGSSLRLDGTGRALENLFDVSLSLTSPSVGTSVATTVAAKSGTFTTSKAFNVGDAHFHLTGYVAPAGDNTWIGERDRSTDSKFQFLETRGIFQEFSAHPPPIGGSIDQYEKENDPHSVMPLRGFNSQNGIRWEAGGRFYSITNAPVGCLSPVVCTGTWSDIAGRVANRVPEGFPPVVSDLPNRTVEANTAGGANLTLAAPPAFDLDGTSLSYTWSGDFPTTTDLNPTVFLSLGVHQVCLAVSNSAAVANRCATITVVDTTPPAISCGSPDGLWHATDVSIPCSASDVGSGLVNPADAAFSLSTHVPAGTQTANAATDTRTVCDTVGNCAVAGPITGNKVDKKPPAITITQPAAAEYVHSAVLTLDYIVDDDAGSGVNQFKPLLDGADTLAGHGLDSGQAINLLTELPLGPHTFTINAVDNVGNASAASVTFTIIVTASSIKDEVNQLLASGAIKNQGLANSLLAKLDAAARARTRGNCTTAANIYQAFIHELQAQSGKGVEATAAAILMADAQYLIAHCP